MNRIVPALAIIAAAYAAAINSPDADAPQPAAATADDVAPQITPTVLRLEDPAAPSEPAVRVPDSAILGASVPAAAPAAGCSSCPPTVRRQPQRTVSAYTYRRGPLGLLRWRVPARTSNASGRFWTRGPVRRLLSRPWRR